MERLPPAIVYLIRCATHRSYGAIATGNRLFNSLRDAPPFTQGRLWCVPPGSAWQRPGCNWKVSTPSPPQAGGLWEGRWNLPGGGDLRQMQISRPGWGGWGKIRLRRSCASWLPAGWQLRQPGWNRRHRTWWYPYHRWRAAGCRWSWGLPQRGYSFPHCHLHRSSQR